MTIDTTELATGWGPSVPDDDTLVLAAVRNLASRIRDQAGRLDIPLLEANGVVAADFGFPHPMANPAVVIEPAALGESLDALAGFYPADRPYVVMSPVPAPAAGERGFALIGHPPFMVRPAGPRAAGSDITVRQVTTPADLAEWERVFILGYPLPELSAGAPNGLGDPRLVGDGPSRQFTAYAPGGEPVAVAASHTACGVNQVEFVATLATHRHRGFGAAATWAATLADPSLPAVLIASDAGRPVYQRMGYLPVSRWSLWARLPESG